MRLSEEDGPQLAQGYNHGSYLMAFYKGLELHAAYVVGLDEGCLRRVAEDRPDGARTLREYLQYPELRGYVVDVSSARARCGRGGVEGVGVLRGVEAGGTEKAVPPVRKRYLLTLALMVRLQPPAIEPASPPSSSTT